MDTSICARGLVGVHRRSVVCEQLFKLGWLLAYSHYLFVHESAGCCKGEYKGPLLTGRGLDEEDSEKCLPAADRSSRPLRSAPVAAWGRATVHSQKQTMCTSSGPLRYTCRPLRFNALFVWYRTSLPTQSYLRPLAKLSPTPITLTH